MTEKQRIDILEDMKIICDTREQRNEHIKNYLLLEGIEFEDEKLDVGDYTCVFPNYPELELDGRFIVERKGSINELAGNFTQHRSRFVRQFERLEPHQKMHMVVEGCSWRRIFNGSYRSKLHPNSYKGSIFTFCIRYGTPIWFCEKKESPEIIYKILHYEVREYLKGLIK